MILTVCLSPCIDVTVELDSFNIGQTNIVKNKYMNFGGKALNVAIGVKRLGGDATTTGFLANGNKDIFEQALKKDNVNYDFVYTEGRVRENYKFIDQKSMLTEVNDRNEPVSDDKWEELFKKIETLSKKSEITVISGSLPKGVTGEYYKKLFDCVDKKCLRIADAKGDSLFSALSTGIDLIKPNLHELEDSLGREFTSKEDMLAGCKELIDRGAKIVLLSLGRNGAVITDGKRNLYCRSVNVAINSTVGAGDGMVAAAAMQLKKGADLSEILRAGVAAGTAAVTSFGDNLFLKSKYDEIYKSLHIIEI